MVVINKLITKENVTIDSEKGRIIIKVSGTVILNVLSSALYSFSDDNYILLDKDNINKNLIVIIVSKNKLDDSGLKQLSDNIISQINVYHIHKQKLEKHKEFVDFLKELIIKTNTP